MGNLRTDITKSRAARRVALAACGLVAAAVLAPLIALSSAAPAAADEAVCGMPQSEPTAPGGEPTYDLNGLQQLTTQGNLTVINEIRDAFNLGHEWCGPLEFATEVGANVVAGTVWELVDLNVPEQYDVIIAVAETEWQRLTGVTPSPAPAQAPSQLAHDGSGASFQVAWTSGIGLHIRPSPDRTAPSLGTVPDGATLSIGCTTRSETVTGPFGPTNLWDYVSYNGQKGARPCIPGGP